MRRFQVLPVFVAVLTAVLPAAAQESPWSDPPAIPVPVGDGFGAVSPSGDSLYVAAGGGRSDFLHYGISTETWTALAPVPAPVGAGGALVHRPGTTLLYLLPGAGSPAFYAFDTATGLWTGLAAAPAAATSAATQIAATPNRIFAFIEAAFWKFTPDEGAGAWTTAGTYDLDTPLACLVYPGEGSHLYGVVNDRTFANAANLVLSFVRYSLVDGSWEALPAPPLSPPTPSNFRAVMAPGPGASFLYLSNQGGLPILSYTVEGGWTELPNSGLLYPSAYSALCAPEGSDTLFLLSGANVMTQRYSFSAEAGIGPALAYASVATNGALVAVGDGKRLYALMGGGTTFTNRKFNRYTIGGGWEGMASVSPVSDSVGSGASLAHDGADSIYLAMGNNTGGLKRYSISGDSWTTLPSLPVLIGAGGQILWIGGERLGILAKGHDKLRFYGLPDALNPSGTATAGAPLPGGIKFAAGASMVRPGSGDLIYVIPGGGTGFLTWSISGGTWLPRADLPAATGKGSSSCHPGGDLIYVFRGDGYPTLWTYSIAADAWSEQALAPGAPELTQSLVHPGGNTGTLYAALPFAGSTTSILCAYEIPNEGPEMGSPGQYRFSGAPLAHGSTTHDVHVSVKATVSDPDGHPVRLEAEAVPVGDAFGDEATVQGPFAPGGTGRTIDLAELPTGVSYRWQVRATDIFGKSSPWVPFSPLADDLAETDFRLEANTLPAAALVTQRQASDGSVAGVGDVISGDVEFSATVTDADGDEVVFEVDVKALEVPYSEEDRRSVQAAEGVGLIPGGLAPGEYRWRYRLVDSAGGATPWTGFGGNFDELPDFILRPAESDSGGRSCGQSAPGGPAGVAVLLLLGAGPGIALLNSATRLKRRARRR